VRRRRREVKLDGREGTRKKRDPINPSVLKGHKGGRARRKCGSGKSVSRIKSRVRYGLRKGDGNFPPRLRHSQGTGTGKEGEWKMNKEPAIWALGLREPAAGLEGGNPLIKKTPKEAGFT